MQSPWTVSQVQLDPGQWATDYIRGYALYASLDNATWGTPIIPQAMVGSMPHKSCPYESPK